MKNVCIAALLLLTAELAWAQAPTPSYIVPHSDLFGGFQVTSPDYGPSWHSILFYGFEGAFSRGITERLWITASADFVWGNPSIFGVQQHVKQFSGTLGPKFFILTKKWRPYATVQAGFARQTSRGLYAADHHPPLPPGVEDIESGFTYRFGGGVEYQAGSKWYIRLGQFDIQPQPWGRHKPFYKNMSAGVGYRF
jgi:outer membrane protein with beta-barrel domain